MKKYRELAAVIVLILFLTATGFTAFFSFPAVASAGYFPIITLPPVSIPPITLPPDILLLANNFREISTGAGAGDFSDTFTGGLDYSMSNILAVGSLDEDNPQIRFFDGTSWYSRAVDFRPTGLEWELDYRPDLYASDSYNDKIYVSSNPASKFPSWELIGGTGSDIGEFNNPLGMTIDDNDNLYVVDSGNDRIQRYNDGTWNLFPGIASAGTLVDIVKTGASYFVTDFSENCLWYKFNSSSPWVKIEDADYLNYPTYLDADSEGNLYIVSWIATGDEFERAIVKYSDGGFSIFVSPGEGIGNIGSTFSFVEEICINHHDRLFYSDNTYSRVEKEKDDINELTGLTINGFQFQLMPGWTGVDYTVEPDVDEADITVYRLCPYSVVEGDGIHPLEFGENIFPVTCTSEKGVSKEYTIIITRELSDNPLLSDITIDTVPIDGFNPNIFAYTGINFPNEAESIELSATPQDPNAAVTGIGIFSLDVGENLFVISVTAQDEVTDQQYIVVINRAEAPESPTPTPTPSPSSTPGSTPSPTPASSSTPEPTPTAGTTPSPTPAATGTTEPTPTPVSTTEPTPTPSSSAAPSTEPPESPEPGTSQTVTPSPSPNPGTDDENADDTFGDWIKEHPGITAAAGVVAGGTFILVAQQIIKKIKKKNTQKSPE